jgi:hypothetical protein
MASIGMAQPSILPAKSRRPVPALSAYLSNPGVSCVLAKQIDDLEPTLTRHGYTAKVLTEMLGTKPGEIKALFKQTLEADRARELKEQMLAAGLPV